MGRRDTVGNSWSDAIKSYAQRDVPRAGPRDLADVLGAEGWELVTATPSGSMWLKRPLTR